MEYLKLILISILLKLLASQNAFYYSIQLNLNISTTLHQKNLISSFKKPGNFFCLSECNLNPSCLCCSFDTSSSNCFLYGITFSPGDFSASNNAAVYSKKGCDYSLLCHFQNPVLKKSITISNGVNFSLAMSTEMVEDNGIVYYYVVDYSAQMIIKHDSSWAYISNVTITNPKFIKKVKNSLFVSSPNVIYKLDYDLNILNNISNPGSQYTGIYYNSTDDSIFTCAIYGYRIDIFNFNLTLLGNISTGSHSPYGINGFKDSLYVSVKFNSTVTVVFVIQNRQIIKTISFSPTTAHNIQSILIDDDGYMALPFENGKLVKLYHVNGSYTGLNITLQNQVFHLNYDSNKILMITALKGIYFY